AQRRRVNKECKATFVGHRSSADSSVASASPSRSAASSARASCAANCGESSALRASRSSSVGASLGVIPFNPLSNALKFAQGCACGGSERHFSSERLLQGCELWLEFFRKIIKFIRHTLGIARSTIVLQGGHIML